jgi:CheY-like chemotaxis protein
MYAHDIVMPPWLVALRARAERRLSYPRQGERLVTSTILLLLVEDEPLIALSAHDALEAGGFALLAAEDGHKALQVLESRACNLAGLVTDVRLGSGPSGWDVARHARKLNSDIPVLYTTADSAHEWTAQGVPRSLLIQKPYAAVQLITAISTLLTQSDTNAA